VAEWTRQRIPLMAENGFGPCAAIGVENGGGRLIAGVVYHGWQPPYGTIEISCASDSAIWLTRSLITGILSYPFVQLGCQRISAATPRSAHIARKFLRQIGFVPEGISRRGFGTQDAMLFGMLAEEWAVNRFNLGRSLDGQEGRTHPADAA
jgi:RimJ/RimL family protein N-acetyltransferase